MYHYPPGAAGVHVGRRVLSGDDWLKFYEAGIPVECVHVQCSAKLAAGNDTLSVGTDVRAAIDLNNRPLEEVAAIAGLYDPLPATGIYDGATHDAVVGWLPHVDIIAAHARLLEELPGFGCFAVLT